MEPVRWGRDDLVDDMPGLVEHVAAMEPVRWGRDDRFAAVLAVRLADEAAMEPVRWGRDDRQLVRGFAVGVAPQWSPSAGDGTTGGGQRRRRSRRRPQWSPSAGDGTTLPVWPSDERVPAAMEPVRWGRDDPEPAAPAEPAQPPQWSPSAGDGTTGLHQPPEHPAAAPQWSPSAGDGTTTSTTSRRPSRTSRNGARPLGTGRPVGTRDSGDQLNHAAMEPVRWGRDDPHTHEGWRGLTRAAMEPVRWGRDDRSGFVLYRL